MSEFSDKFQSDLELLNIPAEHKNADAETAVWFLSNGIRPNKDHPRILSAIYHALKLREEARQAVREHTTDIKHIN